MWRLFDGSLVESVLMRYPGRTTMCISSQAGCGMNCPFCATGQAGLTRNLSTGEIVDQVIAGARELARGDVPGGPGRVSNVVFMGMGEPMANYPALLRTLHRLIDPSPDGLGMSARGITVSTVGLVPRIHQLAAEGLPVTLAVSLHAPDDELRDTLVPVNTRWKVAEVLDAAWGYAEQTRRRVSIEYALIKDINDQALARRHARGAAQGTPRARQPDPAQPDPRLDLDRVAAAGRAGVRAAPGGARPGGDRPGHPGAGDRRCLRAAGRDHDLSGGSDRRAYEWLRPSPVRPEPLSGFLPRFGGPETPGSRT